MPTKRELIYNVFEKLNIHSDDAKVSEEFISHAIDLKRSFILKQQYSKGFFNIPREVRQEVRIKMGKPTGDHGGFFDDEFIISQKPLPGTVNLKGKEGPLLVRKPSGGEIGINGCNIERLPYLGNNKFTKNLIYCAIDYNGKLIMKSALDTFKYLEEVLVSDVFENPEEAFELNGEEGDYWDLSYPIESAMADVVIELVTKDLINTLSIPADNRNDSKDGRKE